MKTRFAVAAVMATIGLFAPGAWGVLVPKSEPFTNFDRRIEALKRSPARQAAASTLGTAQDQAVATLQSAVPDLRISKDQILGTPANVSAARGFLTGPGGRGKGLTEAALQAVDAGDPHRVIKAFLNEHSALFGHDSSILASARVDRDYVTEHNGLHSTVWQQTLDEIPVFEALLTAHVTRDGELVSISSHLVPDPAQAANAGTPNRRALQAAPAISATKAIAIAATNVGVEFAESDLTAARSPQGATRAQDYTNGNLFGLTHAELVWLPMDRSAMRLCWQVRLITRVPPDSYVLLVDAGTGDVIIRRLTTVHAITPATYNVFTNDSPSPLSPGLPVPASTQPPPVGRVLVTLPAVDTNASPAGWVAEGPSPRTTGNNVDAFLDRNFDGSPDVPLPQATTNRIFNFPLNTNQQPTSYQSASTVQLFWRANWYHDLLYRLGFTEAAGNYQVTNFARGGLEGDPVICLVQAGADVGMSDNSFFIPEPDGFSGYCAMFVFTGPNPQRDGSLDSEVVIHELTHGTSSRLVGGGVGISQLQTEGMGEGWSDFYALCMLSQPSDNVNSNYAMGGYVTYHFVGTGGFDQNYYYGIRRYPYTTDMSKNPLTFKDIDPVQANAHTGVPLSPIFSPFDPSSANEVHNQGEVWCVTLREVWANIVTEQGWDPGNQLTLQLVTDGMKLAPANPNFLEARDAIIQADLVDTIGENYRSLWLAFAKRGMGFSATSPASDTTAGVHEAFDLPPDLTPDGILEVRVVPPSGEILFSGDTNSIFVRVSDGFGVTNATIAAVANNGTNVVFRNDGVAPDLKANNDVYSTSLNVPTNLNSITITMVISAPGKTNSTNVVTYPIIPIPPNDNFTNAIKVPAAGTNYFTSNRRATMEFGEPAHGGVSSAAASLWWNYTPAVNTNVLVDSGGTLFRAIVAVYTNSTVTNLTPIVSAVGGQGRLGPFVGFNAKAGITYHVALASYSLNSVGVINLAFLPGVQPDTNPPDVTITAPLNGLLVTTNRIAVAATVVDPSPNPSGIKSVSVIASSSVGEGIATPMMPPGSSLLGPISTNWSSLVALQPGQNNIQVFATDFSGNQSAPVSVQVTYRVAGPANDFFANAIILTNTSGVEIANTINATKEAGEPNHAGSFGGHSVWWNYIPSADGILTLTTSNSTFDTVLGMYQGTAVNNLTTIASNDDAYDGVPGGFSEIIQAVKSNLTYHIAVDGFDGQSGIADLNYSFTNATLYHVSVTNTAGGLVAPASADVQSNGTLIVTATPNSNFLFDNWDGDVFSLNNPLVLTVTRNLSLTGRFVAVSFTDDFESGDLRHIAWITNGPSVGTKPWFVQTNVVSAGQFAARSGIISDSQSSSLLFTGNFRADNGSFDCRVSSELNFDTFKFLVDGIQQQQWSGDVPWANFVFPLSAGTHTLEWRYAKDASGSFGLDAAFIDNVNLPLAVATNSTTAANLQIQRQTDGTFYIELFGQTNQQYIFQVSSNLFTWRDFSTNIATSGFLRILDPASTTNGIQFYRAKANP